MGQISASGPGKKTEVDRGSTHLDEIEIHVEVEESFFSDETRVLEGIRAKIAEQIRSSLGIGAVIKLVEPKAIERSLGKAKRVIDKRQL